MALATTVTGDGILVSRGKDTRAWSVVYLAFGVRNFQEVITREVREWVALTETAATTYVNLNAQPEGDGEYTYGMSEQDRIVGAYKVTRSYEYKVTEDLGWA